MDTKQIGKMIRKYRKEKALTQLQLAEQVNVSVNYLGSVERGIQQPSLETLITIANTLGVTADELLMGVVSQARSLQIGMLSEQMKELRDEQITMVLNVAEQMIKDFKSINKNMNSE